MPSLWVDVWYDWNIRSWCIQVKDEYNNQYESESTYVYSKSEAKDMEKSKLEEYDIDPKYNRKKQKEYKEHLKSL